MWITHESYTVRSSIYDGDDLKKISIDGTQLYRSNRKVTGVLFQGWNCLAYSETN